MTSTACLKQPSARMPVRVPRWSRSAFPPLRETFVPVMRVGLARHGLPALRRLGDLLLADLGLVDPAKAWDEPERHGPDAAGCYELVNLELALRSLLD